MTFDVSEKGKTENISAQFCSDPVFEKPSKLTLPFWKFEPAELDGKPVTRHGIKKKIVYNLKGQDGQIIPSSNGYLTPLNPSVTIPTPPKNRKEMRAWLNQHYSTKKSCK